MDVFRLNGQLWHAGNIARQRHLDARRIAAIAVGTRKTVDVNRTKAVVQQDDGFLVWLMARARAAKFIKNAARPEKRPQEVRVSGEKLSL